MSDLVVTDFNDFFISFDDNAPAKEQETVKDKKLIALKVLVIVLGSFLVLEALLYSFVLPLFSAPEITYSGLNYLTKNELNEKLSELDCSTWSGFSTEMAVSVLSTISCVESVAVDKHFPNKISVKIKERNAVAKSIICQDGTSKSVQIDENGILFSVNSASVATDYSVPLVSGLPVDNLQEGMRLPAKYRVLMEQISDIRKLPRKYFAAVSEIQVVPKEYGNYELVLYPSQAKVKVLSDRNLNEDALQYMMVVLDVVNSIEPDVSEIDLRYGAVSYRRR
ncbi:MAG: FtsQ-type POTRA domain-containing protein [Treponema sp.]|uniref:cell division protein FtsQ/DivIB n=1 Tax=Treponema sp. TaxID=166 RepID=UPI001D9E3A7A|nr:FtsQ-type POTRA domain-containing protein [Treponema sp.]MBS7240943.1 FtsQ-type POTRA domain-containing protein [Treponema sp.]